MSKKILFFLDSLRAGGRERRAVELFLFLKKETDFEFQIVLTENIVHYKYIHDLDIPIFVLKKRHIKKDPLQFYKFFQYVKKFKPDIIHSWSGMTNFYVFPSAKIYNIPLINGQIANAIPSESRTNFDNILWKINNYFSSIVIANSFAGIRAYMNNYEKGLVIYNGINLNRFKDLLGKEIVKKKFQIQTTFTIVMVASFNKYKDYNLFFDVATRICNLRKDVTFIGVGEGASSSEIFDKVKNNNRILLYDQISNVEDLVNSCDIGLLFSNMQTGEGFSNTIMEYMALSKPVIATNAGGTNELVANNISGFLVDNDIEFIVEKIIKLLDNEKLRMQMGKKGCEIIEKNFTIEIMGAKYLELYNSF